MNHDREPDYADALEDGADPSSPQGLPPVTGGGEMDIGNADMPADLEASSAVYWLQAFVDKHPQYKPEMEPWMTRLKQLATALDSTGTLPPGTPPPIAPPPPPGAVPPGAPTPGAPPIAPPAGGAVGAPPASLGSAIGAAIGAPPS